MKWLLWKEFRLQRLVLAVGLFLLLVPYALPLLAWQRESPTTNEIMANEIMAYAALTGIILSIITLALLGGNSIACERADRSAEFQAYQPISRRAILLSKLTLPALAAFILWGAHMMVYTLWARSSIDREFDQQWLFIHMLFGFCAFSVAWFVSARQSSPTFAVGAGMAAPVATLMLSALIFWLLDARVFNVSARIFETTWITVTAVLGLVCFAWGTWHYLTRVDP